MFFFIYSFVSIYLYIFIYRLSKLVVCSYSCPYVQVLAQGRISRSLGEGSCPWSPLGPLGEGSVCPSLCFDSNCVWCSLLMKHVLIWCVVVHRFARPMFCAPVWASMPQLFPSAIGRQCTWDRVKNQKKIYIYICVWLWGHLPPQFLPFLAFSPSFIVKNGQKEMLQICPVSARSRSIETTQNWLGTAVPSLSFNKCDWDCSIRPFYWFILGLNVKRVGLFGPKKL